MMKTMFEQILPDFITFSSHSTSTHKNRFTRLLLKNGLIFSFLLLTSALCAQEINAKLKIGDEKQFHVLETKNGDRFIGRVIAIADQQVRFWLIREFELTFPLAEVKSINILRKSRLNTGLGGFEGGYEHLMYTATGFGYPKGENAYRTVEVFYHSAEFAPSDNFSIGTGFVFPGILAINAKASYSVNPDLHLALGVNNFWVFVFQDGDLTGASHIFGAITLGNRKKFINFGAGLWANWAFREDRFFIGTIGGVFPLSKRFNFMIDAFLVPTGFETIFLPSITASWTNGKRRVDFGFFTVLDDDLPVIPIPAIGYSRRF